jgi:ribosomal protein S18 acetylase RimI-like enzyme
MSAPSVDVLRWGRERARTGLWRGDREVALLTPVPSAPLPSKEFLLRCLDVLRSRGFTRVVTGALSPLEQAGFLAAGFGVAERLHLLGIDLDVLTTTVPDGLPLVPMRGSDYEAVLRVDGLAFSDFWQFDRAGLDDAMSATPHSRARLAVPEGRLSRTRTVAGYIVCGRASDRGFVQRLAVDPSMQRLGTGRRLLLDGLAWMARRGVRRAVVNTQVGNDVALALYLAVGFCEQPMGLSVLEVPLG